ncbi:MAG: PKD domain-containing protein [Myxococcota bacterium]
MSALHPRPWLLALLAVAPQACTAGGTSTGEDTTSSSSGSFLRPSSSTSMGGSSSLSASSSTSGSGTSSSETDGSSAASTGASSGTSSSSSSSSTGGSTSSASSSSSSSSSSSTSSSGGSCVDLCVDGTLRCVDNAESVCGNHDEDACLEWGAPVACDVGERCGAEVCEPLPRVVISELLYDTAGTDNDVFVELCGPAGTSLQGFSLVGINGNNGAPYNTVALTGVIAEDGYYLVTRTTASAPLLALADQSDDLVDYQNGPDSVQLRHGESVVDALGYGAFDPTEVFAGEGRAAPDVSNGRSLGRDHAQTDTDDNAADFLPRDVPTPHAPNERAPQPPSAALACPTTTEARQPVDLDASGSTDGDGTVVTFTFDPGDGQPPLVLTTPSAAVSYATPGAYQARVTVTDDDGLTAEATCDITVTADVTAPLLVVDNLAEAAQLPTGATTFSVTLAFSEPVTGVSSANVTVDGGATLTEPTSADGVSWRFELQGLSNGTGYTLALSAGIVDTVGNALVPVQRNFTVGGGGSSSSSGGASTSSSSSSSSSSSTGGMPPTVVISEALYDTPSSDVEVFVELHGPPGTSLDGFTLVGINGNGGTAYNTITLGGNLRNDGFFVVAKPGSQLEASADLTSNAVDYQNGPDSVQLRYNGVTVDAVGYGSFGPTDVFGGEGSSAGAALPGQSVGRDYFQSDTDDNAVDFRVLGTPTPGAHNRPPPSAVLVCPLTAEVGQPITLDASGSSDVNGSVMTYAFGFDDGGPGEEGTASSVMHSYEMPGLYEPSVRVTDDDGLTGDATCEITAVQP